MTPPQIRSTIQDLIGPNNPLHSLSSTALDDFFLEAAYSVYGRIRSWRTRGSYTASLVAGQSTYAMPSDFFFAESFLVREGSNYSLLSSRSQDYALDFDSGQPPNFYYLDSPGGVLSAVICPAPLVSVVNGLRIYYRKRPAKLSTFSDTQEYTGADEMLHLAMCNEAAWLFLARQGNRAMKDFSGYHTFFLDRLEKSVEFVQEDWAPDAHLGRDVNFGGLGFD